jgi:seryl-tRNA synthetase
VYPIKDFHQTITDFEYSPLDPKTEQRLTDEIEKWEKHDKAVEADIELLKAGHKTTTEDLNTVKSKIDAIEKWEKHDEAVEADIKFLKADHKNTTKDLINVKTKIDEITERLPAQNTSSNMQGKHTFILLIQRWLNLRYGSRCCFRAFDRR